MRHILYFCAALRRTICDMWTGGAVPSSSPSTQMRRKGAQERRGPELSNASSTFFAASQGHRPKYARQSSYSAPTLGATAATATSAGAWHTERHQTNGPTSVPVMPTWPRKAQHCAQRLARKPPARPSGIAQASEPRDPTGAPSCAAPCCAGLPSCSP